MIYVKDIKVNPNVVDMFIEALTIANCDVKEVTTFIEREIEFVLFAEISKDVWNRCHLMFNWNWNGREQ